MPSIQFRPIAALLTSLFSLNAYADSLLNPWAGVYGQVGIIGYASYIPKSASGTTSVGNFTFSNTATANHANGLVANIGGGYNFGVSENYILGIGAALYPGHSKTVSSTSVTNLPSGAVVSHGTYNVSNIFSFSLLPGYVIDKTHLVYAKIGYTGSTLNANSPGNYPQQTTHVNGTVYGLGYKQLITESIYFFGEGNFAVNREKAVSVVTDSGATVKSTANATGYDFILGVGYRF
ncbi:hypothetical protein FD967_08615 [Polynucleobacter sp. JS-Mosq-20-D10]|uniref:outer membrane protein n=1 Tax=Polynucleobacter sp. JS-Mosq-20-D10 TaxID=2576922 RepID=UPI001BFDFB29|nr:hypothetical protein [Polynucleobacter sp. JS-Mosq-20-D10]QWE00089.1 hypothetical protein FD967_08615 [Polynucleobacter sp. JS-Mosq-20-D10]